MDMPLKYKGTVIPFPENRAQFSRSILVSWQIETMTNFAMEYILYLITSVRVSFLRVLRPPRVA